jgi:molybdopterin molybdotransferase
MTILQPVTRSGCGCDGHDVAKQLIPIDAALALIADRTAAVVGTEDIPLDRALGRILADPVTSRFMSPPFDNAAMDGFAFASAALPGDGPWILDVVTRVPAGQTSAMPLAGLQAARIFTGAKVPEGADAVVMQEDVKRTVLDQGRRLDARPIAACAAARAGSITARRRLRVALLVTGDEIRAPGAGVLSEGLRLRRSGRPRRLRP